MGTYYHAEYAGIVRQEMTEFVTSLLATKNEFDDLGGWGRMRLAVRDNHSRGGVYPPGFFLAYDAHLDLRTHGVIPFRGQSNFDHVTRLWTGWAEQKYSSEGMRSFFDRVFGIICESVSVARITNDDDEEKLEWEWESKYGRLVRKDMRP